MCSLGRCWSHDHRGEILAPLVHVTHVIRVKREGGGGERVEGGRVPREWGSALHPRSRVLGEAQWVAAWGALGAGCDCYCCDNPALKECTH